MENTTEVTQFVLLGLSRTDSLQAPLFITLVLTYLADVAGNMGVLLLVLPDSPPHAPVCSPRSPPAPAGFLKAGGPCPVPPALLRRSAASATVGRSPGSDGRDRCAAVRTPLHGAAAVTASVCAALSTGPCVWGFLEASIRAGISFSLSFCRAHVAHHFFGDVPAVMGLSCSDRYVGEMVLVYVANFNIFFALLIILTCYIFIFITILKVPSSAGCQKALPTCACHLSAVSIFCGAVTSMHLQPSSGQSTGTGKTASVFCPMIIPTLNPLVYSLRNKEVKSAFKMIVKARLSLRLSF